MGVMPGMRRRGRRPQPSNFCSRGSNVLVVPVVELVLGPRVRRGDVAADRGEKPGPFGIMILISWGQVGGIVTLIARFQVDGFEPRQVSGLDADWFGLMTFAKTFTSGIVGHATTVFISAGTEEGSRSYVATERITGHTDD